MIEDKDYIMRLTHEIARMLIRLIFGRDIDKEDELPVSVERLQQFKKLTAMIDDGQINEAENQLLDELDPDSQSYFEMALLFYEKLGCKSEEFLEEHQLHGNKRNGKPLSQQTMRHIQNLLSKVLSQAVNRGLIERNPVQGICRSAPKQVKATILADNEIRDYLSAAKDFHKLTERVLMEDLYDRTPHILDHAITILLG